MQSAETIRRHIEHLKTTCPKRDTDENKTWITALEWVIKPHPNDEKMMEILADIANDERTDAVTARLALRQVLARLR